MRNSQLTFHGGLAVMAGVLALTMFLAGVLNVEAQVTNNNSCLDPNYQNQIATIYRYWNGGLVDHFYTHLANETGSGYVPEKTTWGVMAAQVTGTTPFYRYYSSNLTDHFYSTSDDTPGGYVSEGMMGFIFQETVPGAVPLYRLYKHGDHLYTTDSNERSSAMSAGYADEGIEGYVCSK